MLLKAYSHLSVRKKLGCIIALGCVVRLIFFKGLTFFDGLPYTFYSYRLSAGAPLLAQDAFGLRLGLILPTALSLRILGFNQFALVLFPFLCSLAGIYLAFRVGKHFADAETGLLAALLMCFFPLDVMFSSMLYPDSPLAFFLPLSFFLWYRGQSEKRPLFGLLSGLLVGYSYLLRMTALFICFPMAICSVVLKRFFSKCNVLLLAGLLAVMVSEISYYYWQTGNPVYRFSLASRTLALADTHLRRSLREADEVGGSFWDGRGSVGFGVMRGKNWFVEPLWTLTTNQEFGLFYFFIVPAGIWCLFRRRRGTLILVIWAFALLLYIFYGSTTPFTYRPLGRWPRYTSVVTIPAVVILSIFLREKRKWLWSRFVHLTTLLLAATSLGLLYIDPDNFEKKMIRRVASTIAHHEDRSYLVSQETCWKILPFFRYSPPPNLAIVRPPVRLRAGGRRTPKQFWGVPFRDIQSSESYHLIVGPDEEGLVNTDGRPFEGKIERERNRLAPLAERLAIPQTITTKIFPYGVFLIYAPKIQTEDEQEHVCPCPFDVGRKQ